MPAIFALPTSSRQRRSRLVGWVDTYCYLRSRNASKYSTVSCGTKTRPIYANLLLFRLAKFDDGHLRLREVLNFVWKFTDHLP